MTSQQQISARQKVAGRDAVWLQDSPTNLMVVNTVFTLDRIDLETLQQLFSERILREERFERFRFNVIREGAKAYWEPCEDFDIRRHIVLAPPVEADAEALNTREALQEHIGREASKALPSDRPLWQFHFVPNYRDGMSAVITRVHHVLGDGISMLPVVFSLMDPHDMESQNMAKKITFFQRLMAVLLGPWMLLKKFLWRSDRSVLHGPPLSGTKRVAWTDAIPLDLIKEVKNAYGATVNDVIMAVVTGALERYVREHSGKPMRTLRVSMPVNVRPVGELPRLENKFAAVLLALPTGIVGLRERVAAVKKQMDVLKRSPEPLFTYGTVEVMLALLPMAVSRFLIDYLGNHCTSVVSNVPGPQENLTLGGKKLRAMLFWVPQRSKIGIGISILSFTGEVTIGVFCDSAVVPDPAQLVACFHAEVEELRQAVA